jgi:hypothetical protein
MTANGCIDPDSNPQACGPTLAVCGTTTPVCANGVCSAGCGAIPDQCGNACVDQNTNPLHCGGCGNTCGNDEVCVQGNCEQYNSAVGCTQCPCAACGGGDACCGLPNEPTYLICVNGGSCPQGF